MSLQAQPIPRIPEATAKIARRAFRKRNVYMQMRDLLGTFFTDDQFIGLYPADGQPGYAPWRTVGLGDAEMGDGQEHTATGNRVRLIMKHTAPLAPTFGPLKADSVTDGRPIRWIELFLDRHSVTY